ncbi:type VI secretion system-associated FHA domain protein TagH [Chimaeribacter californicus]|uniref:Type VI secretion system-associated FHA domain protein TagH n=1 Tax=Chimaeribacter californicus TaxID=2060067 RepID=A0A2N5E750_9GAMM|nr:type VI secretion system-associated FHA domain protein TagH [Chimaeribacter californicus]PLR37309.1 type VI secretion system-associated FHA domain protein TagH [Chimaeribacter californicus]
MRFTIVKSKQGHFPPQSSFDFLPPGGTIGRSVDNNLVLPDEDRAISRLQAIVHISADGECRITNRGNVTRVVLNDIPLERGRQVELQDGDLLDIDDYQLQVTDLSQSAPPPSYTTPPTEAPKPKDTPRLTGVPRLAEVPRPVEPAAVIVTPPPPVQPAASPQAYAAPERYVAPEHTAAPEHYPENYAAPEQAAFVAPAAQYDAQAQQRAEQALLARQQAMQDAPLPAAEPQPLPLTPPEPPRPAARSGRLGIDPVGYTAPPVPRHSNLLHGSPQALDGNMLNALLEGIGLNDLQPPPRFDEHQLREVGRLLSLFSQGTVALLSSRSILKRGVKAEMTMILDEANNPFKLLPSGKTVLMQMFGSKMPGFMPPEQAVRDALIDLQAHQLGMIAGIRAIISAMLQSFNPDRLEEEARREGNAPRFSLSSNRKAALWDHFAKTYQKTAGEVENDFHTLFGEAFLRAYDAEVNQYKDSQIKPDE